MGMKINKALIVSAVLVGVAIGTYMGINSHLETLRRQADERSKVVLREYYAAAENGAPSEEGKTKLVGILAEMAELCKRCSPGEKKLLVERRMDGAFILGDFDTAIALVDELTGYTDNWKVGVKAKIRAHVATLKGNKAAAFAAFSDYTATLEKEPDNMEEFDPYNKVNWTKQGLLGRNKKRLAALADELGNKEAAAKLRQEATEAYKAALVRADEDGESDTREVLEKDAGDLLK